MEKIKQVEIRRPSYRGMSLARVASIVALLSLGVLAVSLSGCYFGYRTFSITAPGGHRAKAEQLRSQGKYLEAIAEYRSHMAYLRSLKSLPMDLNPAFYNLNIGDIFLELDNISAALESYQTALMEGIDKESIVDRVRTLARHVSAKGDYSGAIGILEKYQELDPLLIGSDLDTLHKAEIWKQDGTLISPARTPVPKPTPLT